MHRDCSKYTAELTYVALRRGNLLLTGVYQQVCEKIMISLFVVRKRIMLLVCWHSTFSPIVRSSPDPKLLCTAVHTEDN